MELPLQQHQKPPLSPPPSIATTTSMMDNDVHNVSLDTTAAAAAAAASRSIIRPAADDAPLSADDDAADVAQEIILQHSSGSYRTSAVAVLFSVPAIGGFLFGFDISATSFAIFQLVNNNNNNTTAIIIAKSAIWQGLFVSATSLGAFVASFGVMAYADTIGRRAELRYGASFYVLGTCGQLLAATLFFANNNKHPYVFLAWLLTSRWVYGFGVACTMHGGPTYLAEMAPYEIRGWLITLQEASIVLGILCGFIAGYVFADVHNNGWVLGYGCSLPLSVLMVGLAWTQIPPSCRWLLLLQQPHREQEALESMQFVFGDDGNRRAEVEFEAMKASAQRSAEIHEDGDRHQPEVAPAGPLSEIPISHPNTRTDGGCQPSLSSSPLSLSTSIWSRKYRSPMVAGMGLVILQQMTGQPTMLSYAMPIFQNAGLSSTAPILVALFKVVTTLVAAQTVEHCGRKKLLTFGTAMMLSGLILLTVVFGMSFKGTTTLVLFAMLLFIGGYQFSFGPITILITAEVFPLSIRGRAVAVAVQLSFLCYALVQFALPVLERTVGLNFTFGIFALLTAFSMFFVNRKVPETKGLTLEEIEQQFEEMRRREDEMGPLIMHELANMTSRVISRSMYLHQRFLAFLGLSRQDRESATNVRSYQLSSVILLFSVPALGGFLFGYDIAATSYAILQFRAFVASPATEGLIVAASSIGAFLGSLVIFGIADVIGRRAELRYGAILYSIGAALEVCAGFASKTWLVVTILLMGRLVYGLGIACAMHGAPTYIAEQSPSEIRGVLVSLKEACIVFGILMGYVVGYAFSHSDHGWMYTYACSVPVSAVMLLLSFVIPRSSRWLLLRGNEEDALKSIRFVFSAERATEEFEAMRQQHEATTSSVNTDSARSESIFSKKYRAPFTAGIGLVVLQQITGQPSVLSYATPIFKDAGLSDSASIIVALFKLVATVMAAVTVERYGRKPLLFAGNGLMLVALLVLTLSFGVAETNGSGIVILLAMFAYISGYQFSYGPITWLMISEVFPLAVRGQAVALSVQSNFLFNSLVQFAVPILQRVIGLNATFGIFALLTAYSICFVRGNVPETKGLTLEEIEEQFEGLRRRESVTVETEPLIAGESQDC